MKKILILNYGLHIAGVSRTLVNFANALVNHGYDVTIKIEIPDFTLAKELDSRVKCELFLPEPYIFGVRVRGYLRLYQKLLAGLFRKSPEKQYKRIVRDKYDIEIAFNRGAAARIIAASTNKSARHLAWVHSDYMRNNNPLAGFESLEDAKKGYAKFDRIISVSEQAERAFEEKFGFGYPLTTRYNIADVNRIRNMAQRSKLKNEKMTIVAVGRVCEAKNYKLLLDTVTILKNRGLDFDCQIIGDGDLMNEISGYRSSLQLDNVHMLGAQTNPYPYMKAADIYVSSSIYEGLSTTTIEAIILGKPCVVTDCAGMKSILGENNEYGVVVPIEAEALADALEKMIVDAEYRNAYAVKALDRAKFFDPERAFEAIEETLY